MPRLRVEVAGAGQGVVVSRPQGIECPGRCSGRWPAGSTIELLAIVEEGSTFEGWSGAPCAGQGDNVLSCRVVVTESGVQVRASFGRAPEEVEVAWVEEAPTRPEREMDLQLPRMEELPPQAAPPEEPPPEEPPPEPPPVPARPPEPLREPPRLKSVEVPEGKEVEQAPADARFLSDKNRDTAEETRARDSNLERQSAGQDTFSERSDVQSPEPGAAEDEVAQLADAEAAALDARRRDRSSDPATGATRASPGEDGQEGEEGQWGERRDQPGALSMRGIEGRGVPGRRSPVDGTPGPSSAEGSGSAARPGVPGKAGRRGVKTRLEQADYEQVVGADVVAREVELGRSRQSRRKGRWERKLAAIQSSLENFTPDVRPGNQTALKTRAAPFAVFIARMHRRIHELWGFGFLEELDGRPATDPLNDWELVSKIEIVLEADGSVAKTTIVRHSGVLMFDVAAMDTVYSAGPYEAPPAEIRSPDGKIYLIWTFHRDHRQCATDFVEPYILSGPPGSDRGAASGAAAPRRQRASAGQLTGPAAGGEVRAGQPGLRPVRAGGPANQLAASAPRPASLPAPENPHARHAANRWLTGLRRGDVARMLALTALPLRTGAAAASTEAEATSVYRTLVQETGRQVLREWKLVSAAGYRRLVGRVPAGFAATDHLFLVLQLSGQLLTVVFQERGADDYRVTGLLR